MPKGENASVTARHLDLSRARLQALEAEGVIKSLVGGGYDLNDTRVRYIRFLRDRPARSAVGDDLRAAKIKALEAKTAREEHRAEQKIIKEMLRIFEEATVALMNRLDGTPAAYARDLNERKRLADLINDARRAHTEHVRRDIAQLEKDLG